MASFKVIINVSEKKLTQKELQKVLDKRIGDLYGCSYIVEKVKHVVSRADRLEEAEGFVEDAKGIVEELKGEMEEWHDSIPENLQDGSKDNEVQEAAYALNELYDNLDQCDFGNVSFPGMF